MGYYNPIYIYGVEKFLADAKAAGVDGLIVVDLPPEEDEELCLPALQAGLNFIRLATPTTDDKRLPAVLANTSGFVYYVSITGITGAAAPDAEQGRRGGRAHQAPHRVAGRRRLRRAQRRERRAPSRARRDGVVVGSALVDAVRGEPRQDGKATAADGQGGDRPGGGTGGRRARRAAEGGGIA